MRAPGQGKTVGRQSETAVRTTVNQQFGNVAESGQLQHAAGRNIRLAQPDHGFSGIKDPALLFPSLGQAEPGPARRQREPGFFRFIDGQRVLRIHEPVIIAGGFQRDIEFSLEECGSGELSSFFQFDRIIVRGFDVEPAIVIVSACDLN